ncbi:MAG: MFS transporter [Proteobacteria bacterium]|nr:MFS transporter [Pseudomonadota bacterium]
MNAAAASQGQAKHEPVFIWTREFVLLNSAVFLAFANLSIFFRFYDYLQTLPIDPKSFGLLMGVFSAMALIMRPIISPFLHAGNARRWIFIGAGGVIIVLAAYWLGSGFWSVLAIRVLHGLANVVLATSLMTALVGFIPRERSAQAFGILAIVAILPNAIIPPVLPFLTEWLGGFPHILTLFSVIMILIFPLVLAAGPVDSAGGPDVLRRSLTLAELKEDIRNPRVPAALLTMLLFYAAYALVFYYLAGFGQSIGVVGAGFFLTISTIGEIGVRAAAGSFLDKTNKARLASISIFFLAAGYLVLAHTPNAALFFVLGAVLGLCWGVSMPLLNALMFDLSPPEFRAFNTNLGMQMFQGGFFLGPLLGGPIVAHWGYRTLFYTCAAFSLVSAVLALWLGPKGGATPVRPA